MADLNQIKIPLADLRVHIIQLMKEGDTEIGLEDFLVLLQYIYSQNKKG